MPLHEYFKGKGEKVMKSMKKTYGEKKGEKIFYATANKKSLTGPSEPPKKKKRRFSLEREEKHSNPSHMYGSRG
jgi:hypothetical protein